MPMASPILIAAIAASMAVFEPVAGDRSPDVVLAAGDCSAAARQVVAQTGGELLSAEPQNGACVVTVLVPGQGNGRPRKVTVRVPL